MKKEIKIYLEEKEINQLKAKAESWGHFGKGNLSHFLAELSSVQIIKIDSNLKLFADQLGGVLIKKQ
jgi:hypothetical protein